MARLGANPEQLDTLARAMDHEAQRLGDALGQTTSAFGSLWWIGRDGDGARTWWTTTGSSQLRKAVEWLDGLGEELRQQADEQRDASSSGGGGGGASGFVGGLRDWAGDRVEDAREWGSDRIEDAREWGSDRVDDVREWGSDRLEDLGDVVDGEEDDDEGQRRGFGLPGPFDDWARDAGESVVDRGSTLLQYGAETTWRRVTNPGQTAVDLFTGTALLEDVAAVEGIVIEDGEIYGEHRFSDDGVVLTGVSVPGGADGITLGHTVRIAGDAPPSDELLAHEFQHVYDIEDVGGIGFYGSYGADYGWNRIVEGRDHDDAYRDIFWERRAYGLDGDEPRGIFGGIWKGGS